jgi:hypothetical protein
MVAETERSACQVGAVAGIGHPQHGRIAVEGLAHAAGGGLQVLGAARRGAGLGPGPLLDRLDLDLAGARTQGRAARLGAGGVQGRAHGGLEQPAARVGRGHQRAFVELVGGGGGMGLVDAPIPAIATKAPSHRAVDP